MSKILIVFVVALGLIHVALATAAEPPPAPTVLSTSRLALEVRAMGVGEERVCWRLDRGELYLHVDCSLVPIEGNPNWLRVVE